MHTGAQPVCLDQVAPRCGFRRNASSRDGDLEGEARREVKGGSEGGVGIRSGSSRKGDKRGARLSQKTVMSEKEDKDGGCVGRGGGSMPP